DDVVALAILRHPPAGLTGVLVPALDCLDQPPPRTAASAFAPSVCGLRAAIASLRPATHHRIPLNPSGSVSDCGGSPSSTSGSLTYRYASASRSSASAMRFRAADNSGAALWILSSLIVRLAVDA